MLSEDLKPNVTVYGSIFPEPVQVIITTPLGNSVKLIGKGLRSNKVYDSILSPEQIAQLEASPDQEPFDGDATKFRLGVDPSRKAQSCVCPRPLHCRLRLAGDIGRSYLTQPEPAYGLFVKPGAGLQTRPLGAGTEIRTIPRSSAIRSDAGPVLDR